MVLREMFMAGIGALAGAVVGGIIVGERQKGGLERTRYVLKTIPPPTYPEHLRTAIVTATPNITGENFQTCYDHLKRYTTGQYRVLVVETRYDEEIYNHSRDMNIAIRGAPDADYYVLMNDDLFVQEGWLDALINTARKDERIGVVGGLFFYEDGETIQHAGGVFSKALWDVSIWAAVMHRFYHRPLHDCPEALEERDVIFVTGALMLVTKRCAEALGGWDENLKTNWNDVDFCLRAWEKGFRVVYTPQCRAIHKEGATLRFFKRIEDANKASLPHVLKRWNADKIERLNQLVREANELRKVVKD